VYSPTATNVDDLNYQYTGNRLDKIIENAFNQTGYEGGNNTINYNLNGSMVNMKDKGIQGIAYNHLNLPDSYAITQANPFGGTYSSFGVDYLYLADGTKVRKTYFNGGGKGNPTITTNITDYLDGFQYSFSEITQCLWCRTSVAYEKEAFKTPVFTPGTLTPTWILDFVPTAEGFYSFTENRYIYQYRDHLGNARVSYAKNSSGALEIKDTNNYYAFGMNHIASSFGTSNLGGLYSYKYNGKELQTETGMYDYGARFYMPEIGRWGVVDPLAEMYQPMSTYHISGNNPIFYVDYNGMNYDDYGVDNNGNVSLIQKTDDNFDRLYKAKSDSNGNAIKGSNGLAQKAISGEGKEGIDYAKVIKTDKNSGSIISGLANNTPISEKGFSKGINYGTTKNANDALSVFSFAAKNSNVEWGLNATSSLTAVFTGHEAALTPAYFFNKNVGYTLFEIHSHKNLNKPSMGAGGGVNDDYTSALTGYLAHKNAPNKPTYSPMSFMLYAPNNGPMNLWKYWATEKGYGNKNMGTVKTLTVDTIYK